MLLCVWDGVAKDTWVRCWSASFWVPWGVAVLGDLQSLGNLLCVV